MICDQSLSLDSADAIIPKEVRFFYRSEVGRETYSISCKSLSLIELFKSMHSVNPYENISELDALSLKQITILDDDSKPFQINSPTLVSYINKYVLMWEKSVKSECYIKSGEQVITNNPDQIFQKKDIDFIREYIKNSTPETKFPSDIMKKKSEIDCIVPLLHNVSYLQMTGLENKLISYIACLFRNCSLADITTISNDPYFTKLQEKMVDEWNHLNNEKLLVYAKSDTAGNSKTDLNYINEREDSDSDCD